MNTFTACVTDTGRKKTNQDSYLLQVLRVDGERVVFAAVCDGMGGLTKGELASASLVHALDEWAVGSLPDMVRRGMAEGEFFSEIDRVIRDVNARLVELGERESMKVGTTVTALLIVGGTYYTANVGDSRIYLLSQAGISVITHDQTLVMREVDAGRLPPEAIETDPRGHILLQCVGAVGDIQPEYKQGQLPDQALFILCSDGFRHKITAQEMYSTVNSPGPFTEPLLEARLRLLKDTCFARGERDNITALGVYVYDTSIVRTGSQEGM